MFDIIVRLVMSLALISMGLNLFFGATQLQGFCWKSKRPVFCPSVCRLPRLGDSCAGNSVDSGRRFLLRERHLQLAPEIESKWSP